VRRRKTKSRPTCSPREENIILTINNDLKILDMPDTEWEHYMTKRPLPTYAEKLKEIETKVSEWKRHKHYHRHGLKKCEVAEELGISASDLSNYVNTVEGMNFSAWLNSLRVEEAQKLMKSHPELSIFDIGYKVGHPHPNTFKKAFITITGQTPDEWRKENIGK
jgi:AraC-like DNA-binding protein